MANAKKKDGKTRSNARGQQPVKKGKPAPKDKAVRVLAPDQPVRIILEIVLKDLRYPAASMNMLGGADQPTIHFLFTRDRITVLNLTIEDKSLDTPGDSGSLLLDAVPLSGKVNVYAKATGQGTGSLQLTYNGKNLFAAPVDFNFTKGTGSINELPKLP